MSVQKSSYTSKKTGKTTVRYYANVWNPAERRSVIGPMRSTEKLARQDGTDLQRAVAAGKAKAAPKLRKMRLENPEWGANDFLFVSQNGIPIKPHQYANAFRRLLRQFNAEAGKVSAGGKKTEQRGGQLPEITLYGLRTSFATNAMRRLPNAAVISSVMGNSPKTLLQFYVQADKQLEAEVVQKALQDAVGD